MSLDIQSDLMFTNPGILLKEGKEFGYQPTDSTIWASIRSNNIHRLTQIFLWKSLHDTYHVGFFWDHVPNMEILGQCSTCRMPESLEHIMLECNAPGQQQVWQLTERLWRLRFSTWPKLNWRLLLGCGLARFTSPNGKRRVFETHTLASKAEIHNRWVELINSALKRDQLLTNRARFGSLATKKQLVLDTWSGALLDEDSLPDDWIKLKGF
ncbi:hypothetical protein B0H13DRAFT_2241148 [Mycena leptocephala]|nr:hypothetical protein B0H13DRAFT_2241148 [Mycena leptocephala]